jgi:hypothetical protein
LSCRISLLRSAEHSRFQYWTLSGLSIHTADQPLQIKSFRKMETYRMIGGLREVGQDADVAPGIGGGIGDDFLKQGSIHKAGAAEGEEDAAGAQQLEC